MTQPEPSHRDETLNTTASDSATVSDTTIPKNPESSFALNVLLGLQLAMNTLLAWSPLKPNNPFLQWHQALREIPPSYFWSWAGDTKAQHILMQGLFLVVIIPGLVTLAAVPLRIRDPSFRLRLAFQMGLFVAMLFCIQVMRAKAP